MSKLEASLFLDYYLDDRTEAEFAVMLDAPWGAGKTHFIKEYMKDRASSLSNSDKRNYFYASLYGITSTSDITDQFFAQAHPILNSKASRIFGAIASKALNGFTGTDVNSAAENNTIIQNMIMTLEGKILIFDDLERSSMNIAEVMGFINSYVEHEKLKVIILANENDIPQDQLDIYNRQKEKLIGKTIRVQSDPNEVIEKFIDRLNLSVVKRTALDERTALLSTFLASGKTNYRNLRAILAEYERLVNAVDPRLQGSAGAMKQLLLYMIATGHEYRNGDLDAKTLEKLPTSQYFSYGIAKGEDKPAEVKAFEKLKSKYPEVKWIDPIVSPTHLANLYRSGSIDIKDINNALSQHPSIIGNAETPPWRLLWSWTDLSKVEYLKAREKLLIQLSNFEITHPGLILHIAASIEQIKDFEDKILGKKTDSIVFFKKYLRELIKRDSFTPDRKTFDSFSTGYAGFGYSSSESDNFKSIYELVKSTNELQLTKKMKAISAGFIKRITSNPDEYSSLYDYGFEEGKYADVPFLHNINTSDFAKILIIDSSPNDLLFASLARRYESEPHYSQRLKDEYEWLSELEQKLKKIIDTNTPPHKKLLIMRITYYFGLINKIIQK